VAQHSTSWIADLRIDTYTPEGGSKARLLFVHGAWVGGWIWEGFAPAIADAGYVCDVVTLRGHYDSKPVDDIGKVSVHDYVQDVLDVTAETQPQGIVGESMGGLIALKACESYRAQALVLMNPAPPFMVPTSPDVLFAQIKYLPDLVLSRPNMPNFSDYKKLILNNVDDLEEVRSFYERICHDSGKALAEMSLGRIKIDPAKITTPVRLIVGHLDAVFPPKVHHRLGEMVQASIADYPEMSHHTFSEEGWETVAEELVKWLADRIKSPVS
jgi:pimeloyl-ACP methyl ester carboxylesterase